MSVCRTLGVGALLLTGVPAWAETDGAPPSAPSAAGDAASMPTEGSAPSRPDAGAPMGDGASAVPEVQNPDNPIDRLDPTAPLDDATRLRIFRQTEKRLAEIDRRERELALREQRAKKDLADLELRMKSLRMVQSELSGMIAAKDADAEKAKAAAADKKKTEAEKQKVLDDAEAVERKAAVERLSRVFEKMKPGEIAKVVPEMDEALVVEVLGKLKDKTTAKVLGTIEPEKAARLSEKLARLKKKQAEEAEEAEGRN